MHMKRNFTIAIIILLVGGLLTSACGVLDGGLTNTPEPEPTPQPITPIRFALPSQAMPLDALPVLQAVNEYLQSQAPGLRLYLEPYDPQVYDEALPELLEMGRYDIVWGEIELLESDADRFLPLNPYLNGSALSQSRPDYLWDVGVRDGNILGISAYDNYLSTGEMAVIKTALDDAQAAALDDMGRQADTDAVAFFDALGEAFGAKESHTRIPLMPADTQAIMRFGFEPLTHGLAVRTAQGGREVVNYFATPEFASWVEFARKWYDAGYYGPNVVVGMPKADAYAAMFVPADMDARDAAQALAGDCTVIAYTPPFIAGDAGQKSMLFINKNSANADAAAEFLRLLNTDEKLFNLLAFGIEGDHYTLAGNGIEVIKKDAQGRPLYGIDDAVLGNRILSAALGEEEKAQMNANNDVEALSPTLGFVLDLTAVESEIAAIEKVLATYERRLVTGSLKNHADMLAAMLEELEEAGMSRVVTQVQGQLDAYHNR